MLKNSKINILTGKTVWLLSIMLMVMSCSKDSGFRSENGIIWENPDGKEVLLRLNVLPLTTRASNADVVTEMIQSLRIVIIDMDAGIIEVNHYVPFDGSDVSEPVAVSNFQYKYTLETVAGNKRVYLFANEGSVGEVSFQPASGVTIPSGITGTLSQILNNEKFQEGLETGATDFINVADAIYFEPVYEADSNNDIFLPYVSMYEEHTSSSVTGSGSNKEVIEWKTYMVPVATKFVFQFTNNRAFPVFIENISLSDVNDDTFLLARLGEDEYKDYTDLDGVSHTNVYWVDWLAQISALSQGYTGYYDNVGFNELFGWISDYSVPSASTLSTIDFIDTGVGAGVEVPELIDETPGYTVFGPYYVPESLNNYTYTETNSAGEEVSVTQQRYNLSITFNQENQSNSRVPEFTNVTIENLKSLFRNTSVIIRVNMNQGDVQIYAEIADWTEKSANGWVVKQ